MGQLFAKIGVAQCSARVKVKILVAEPIAEEGIALLRSAPAEVEVGVGLSPRELRQAIGDYDGLVVRSQTRVTAEVIEAGRRLQVIGRAGVGVDNIDMEAATRRGIVVVNAPAGNVVAAAEHTVALMLALARHIPQADADLRAGRWERSAFLGVEIRGKVLGIIGLGKVGAEVARRAQGLEMKVVAHDPFVTADHAQKLGVELWPFEMVLRTADFLTLHTPLTPATRGLIGAKELALMKPTARLINTARGGIVDEEALYAALQEGRLAGAAVDVFSKEPAIGNILLRSPRVIATPHLGASTEEAQMRVALDVAEQVVAVLQGRPVRYAVNLPLLPEAVGAVWPYLGLVEKLGSLCTQLLEGQLATVEVTYSGDITEYDTGPLKAALIKGLLAPISEEFISLVNAPLVAKTRGLRIVEQKTPDSVENYASLVTVRAATDQGVVEVSGTIVRQEPHIVRIGPYWVDIIPSGYMLFSRHHDRPGIIGKVGTILGAHDINISFMQVGRLSARGEAVMVLGVDEAVPEELRQQIAAHPGIDNIKLVKL